MSNTGGKIDYTLRIQKNVERKILTDIIGELNFFMPVNKYRYIGFGSFYYKDFLLLQEKFTIHNGISIEKDNVSYAQNRDVISFCLNYFKQLFQNENENIKNHFCSVKNIEFVINNLSKEFCEELSFSQADSILHFQQKGIYDFCKLRKIETEIKEGIELYLRPILEKWKEDESIEEIENCDNNDINSSLLCFNRSVFLHSFIECISNRFLYNKPYGFIDIKFNDLINAFDMIQWSKDQHNIIWLVYDKLITADQLYGLEKSIKNSNYGDLIVFSTSLGTQDDQERYKSIQELKETSSRVTSDIKLDDCSYKVFPSTVSKIVKDTITNAISKKNIDRSIGESEYRFLPVTEFTYNDGTLMYTYGIIIYSEKEDTKNKDFPGNTLKNNKWFPGANGDIIYKIYVPALTHKEVNAINHYLNVSQDDLNVLEEKFPFIESSKLKQYLEIWRYYPNYMEVDSFV